MKWLSPKFTRDLSDQQFFLRSSNRLFSQFEPVTQIDLVSVNPRVGELGLASYT
jgi:hypothetical protein